MTHDLSSVLEHAYDRSMQCSGAIAVYQDEKSGQFGFAIYSLEPRPDKFICAFINGKCHATETAARHLEEIRRGDKPAEEPERIRVHLLFEKDELTQCTMDGHDGHRGWPRNYDIIIERDNGIVNIVEQYEIDNQPTIDDGIWEELVYQLEHQ